MKSATELRERSEVLRSPTTREMFLVLTGKTKVP